MGKTKVTEALKLRDLRESQKMTQREFVNKIGISAATLYEYESGNRNISPRSKQKIIEAFGLSVDYFEKDSAMVNEATKNNLFDSNIMDIDLENGKESRPNEALITCYICDNLSALVDKKHIISEFPMDILLLEQLFGISRSNNYYLINFSNGGTNPFAANGDLMIAAKHDELAENSLNILRIQGNKILVRYCEDLLNGKLCLSGGNQDAIVSEGDIEILGHVVKVLKNTPFHGKKQKS